MHRDRRPDLNSKRRPFTSFCFVRFLKSFYLFLCFVCSAAWKSPLVIPALAHCKSAWEFGGIAASAASPLTARPHARRSREISAAGGGSPKPAGWFPGCRSPRRAIRGRSRHRIASDSMPAGSPLTQARRITADSSPPDRR